ncbi:FRG domain-containing protein [Bradyrhizobium sp. USDA 223]|uniref:FRG domain-containing protein n=1 Tax=Bradyrhizobium sp. USDA 223 TaxID=3156306 RepID=UPI003835E2B0
MAQADWKDEGPGIQVATAASAGEFLEWLRRSNSQWWEGDHNPWVFRGHADENWPLLPSAWRSNNAIISASREEATKRFDRVKPTQSLFWWLPPNFHTGAATFGNDDKKLQRELAISVTAELLPVWDFCIRCNELGLPTAMSHVPPDAASNPDWLWDAGAPLVADHLLRFSDIPPVLALAQHHGLPTRLLDWSFNPVAAAFFAVENTDIETYDNIAVWGLHRLNATGVATAGVEFPNGNQPLRIEPRVEIIRPSVRDNPYLAAQSGLFTTVSASGVYFMQNGGERPSLETFVRKSQTTKVVLRKMRLSCEHVPDLVQTLQREQMSRSGLMPTRDNVAGDVRKRWLDRD